MTNKERTKTTIPKPMLFKNSDSIYSLTYGWSLGTKIIVSIVDKTHFIKEIKLNENPFKKPWIIEYKNIKATKKSK